MAGAVAVGEKSEFETMKQALAKEGEGLKLKLPTELQHPAGAARGLTF